MSKLFSSPLLGVFIARDSGAKNAYFCTEKSQLLDDLSRVSDRRMNIFAFGPEDILWDEKKILGWFPRNHAEGSVQKVDFPAVIYDRFFLSHDSNKANKILVKQTRDRFLDLGLRWINSPAVFRVTRDKWMMNTIFVQNVISTPKTELFLNLAQLQDAFLFKKDEQAFFLKPRYGMKGKGIFRLARDFNGHLSMRGEGRRFEGEVAILDTLRECFAVEEYLIQHAISPPRLKQDGSTVPFDVRILIQRPKEDWEVVHLLGRQGGKDQATSNISGGGEPLLFDQIGARLDWPISMSELSVRLEKMALSAAVALQKEVPEVRDIGLDVILDQQGTPYLLEMNAKPMLFFYQAKAQGNGVSPKDKEIFVTLYWHILENLVQAARSELHLD
ncbi:MAG: hypothetical protein UT55_C0095G0006 [Candidatus Peregrinibacteria bacterium GW2011_GWE2_39_6]|nr:MAG: hypothetical protein UT55_C0095G0006 [Candidatus Peregrinibacteria bacterium GW2011_GWE2_39_6]